jgi:hypothetical protein
VWTPELTLLKECDEFVVKVEHALALSGTVKDRDNLKSQLGAAKAEYSDYDKIVVLGRLLKAAEAEVARQLVCVALLSAEYCQELVARHAALVMLVDAKCKEKVQADDFDGLERFAEKLKELKALDVSSLVQAPAVKAVQLPLLPPPQRRMG